MERRPLGRSGLEVPVLSLGTMNFGSDWHGVGAVGEAEARSLVDLALDGGVDLFDTADIYGYGASETMLGKVLGARRPKVLIASKVLGRMVPGDPSSGGLSRRHIVEAAEASLRRLGTDYLDLYMPHGVDASVPLEESLRAFDDLVRGGKVRALGCSNFPPEALRDAVGIQARAGLARFEFDQVQFSLAWPRAEEELAPVCAAQGVSLLAWSPLGGGFLSGKYRRGRPRPAGRRQDPARAFPEVPEERLDRFMDLLGKVAEAQGLTPAQAALGWVLGRPGLAGAVLGCRTLEQLREDLGAKPLPEKAASLLARGAALAAA